MSSAEYKQQVTDRYNQASAFEYGGAGLSVLEGSTLKILFRQIQHETRARLLGEQEPDETGRVLLRQMTRENVLDTIIRHGWPQPEPENVKARDIAETAIEHACVVAEYLVDVRGPEASPATFFSYTTKNQFDRFVSMYLIRNNRLGKSGDLSKDWYSPQFRQPEYHNPNVRYPDGVDDSKIYGIAKPHRYWPAQLLRNLEAIRLGKISDTERKMYYEGNISPDVYTIPWISFADIIDKATSVDEIAVGIAIRTMEILLEKGLDDQRIETIIVAGYSPKGPMNEHGNIPEVHQIWNQLLNNIQKNNKLKHLHDGLLSQVEKRVQEAGFTFNHAT